MNALCACVQSQAYEFQFGLEYAWTMCIFAVSMTYSITCPIITPFGEQHSDKIPIYPVLSTFRLSSPSLLVLCVCVCVSCCNLAADCPSDCRLCEFAAVVPDTQTQ